MGAGCRPDPTGSQPHRTGSSMASSSQSGSSGREDIGAAPPGQQWHAVPLDWFPTTTGPQTRAMTNQDDDQHCTPPRRPQQRRLRRLADDPRLTDDRRVCNHSTARQQKQPTIDMNTSTTTLQTEKPLPTMTSQGLPPNQFQQCTRHAQRSMCVATLDFEGKCHRCDRWGHKVKHCDLKRSNAQHRPDTGSTHQQPSQQKQPKRQQCQQPVQDVQPSAVFSQAGMWPLPGFVPGPDGSRTSGMQQPRHEQFEHGSNQAHGSNGPCE